MISARAPDGGKNVGGSIIPIYKIRDTDETPGVILTNTITPSRPYLLRFSVGYDTGTALKELFTNNLQTLTLYFDVPSDPGAAEDTYTIVLTSGTGTNSQIETLFTKTSENNYNFLLPAIDAAISGTSGPITIDLYYDGTNFITSGDGSNLAVSIKAESNNRTQFNDYRKTVLFGKTFNMTLTGDNIVNIPTTATINCGTYTGS